MTLRVRVGLRNHNAAYLDKARIIGIIV